jgi:Domain of unknown function (DUF4397)
MRVFPLAALGAAILLSGCGPEAVGPRNSETALLRLASASPDAGSLDLLVNGRTVARGVGSTAVSASAVVLPGRAAGEVRASGTDEALASVPLTLAAGKSYTVLVAGPRAALTAMVSVDTSYGFPTEPIPVEPVDSGNPPPPPSPDAVRFRLLHAAPHAPPLDPYLLPAGAALDTLPTLQPFAYGSLALTADLVRAPGRYVVKFTDAGTTHVVLVSGEIDAAAGELLTVVLGENADRTLRVDVMRE